jgi:integrase/recombinase XerD
MGKNEKGGSLKIPDKAAAIIDQYKAFQENKDDLVFPELKGVDFANKFVTQRTIAKVIS